MSLKNKIISSILLLSLFNNGTLYAYENNNNIIEEQNKVVSSKDENSNVGIMSEKTNITKEATSISKKHQVNILSVLKGVLYGLLLITGTTFISYIGGQVAIARSSFSDVK